MNRIQHILGPARITQPRYWFAYLDEPRLQVLRNRMGYSRDALAEALANCALENRCESKESVLKILEKRFQQEPMIGIRQRLRGVKEVPMQSAGW